MTSMFAGGLWLGILAQDVAATGPEVSSGFSYWPFGLSVAFVVGIFIATVLWRRDEAQRSRLPTVAAGTRFPFRRATNLLSDNESKVLKLVQFAAGDDAYVFAKVRLIDLLTLPPKTERRDFYVNLARARMVDYVVCDKKTSMPIAALHFRAARPFQSVEDDELIEDILAAAGMAFVRLSVNESYTPQQLREAIREQVAKQMAAASPVGGRTKIASDGEDDESES